ncbi:replication initiation protein [Gemmiger sp.]
MTEKDKIIKGEYIDPDTPATEEKKPRKSKSLVPKYNPASESIITKSNDLIQKTKYALPKLEQKVLLAMMAQINPKEVPDADRIYSLSFADFGRLAGVNMHDNTYLEYLKDTVKSLEDRSFWSLDPASDGHQYKVLSWLQRGSTVNDRDKQIRVRFNPEILPYLSQLKSNYTSYNVEYLLTMNSTYSMRFYEILLSYDNGDMDYGYTNGLVFQPVTQDILDMFPDYAKLIRGFKYKVFDIQELKEQLSPPPEKRRKDKEKPLTEKYSNFHDFERYVLLKAKDEINEMTDLWFEYIPVRVRGGRKYERLYLFIRYKTAKEMDEVRRFHEYKVRRREELPRRAKNSKVPITDQSKLDSMIDTPFSEDVYGYHYGKVHRILIFKTRIREYREQLDEDFFDVANGVMIYTARLLTNTSNEKKKRMAVDTRDALNRIIEEQGDLRFWLLGMARMMLTKQEQGQLKSPQYNATVVYNAIDDMSIIPLGKQELRTMEMGPVFKTDLSVFDE